VVLHGILLSTVLCLAACYGLDDGGADQPLNGKSISQAASCGDGIVDAPEQCDDGNTANGDGCDANCTLPVCGNGILDAGEQCDDGNTANGDSCEATCTLAVCGNGILDAGEQCDDGNTINFDACDNHCNISTATYFKASNTGPSDQFGTTVALSADGSTMAVGAPFEDSASGANGDQNNNASTDSGAVYVFVRSGTTWIQQAYLKSTNPGTDDRFGSSIALSADGSTLAVGAPNEDSNATGVGGDSANNAATNAGAAYVFTRSGTTWSPQAYIKASNTGANDNFGQGVALSGDGSILVVGSPLEDSITTGINGTPNESGTDYGAAYAFTRDGTTWTQQAFIKASSLGYYQFGWSVALSADGTTLAVGANNESSLFTGAGAVFLFTHSRTDWSQQAYLRASNLGTNDHFGTVVALSADGSTLAVGAPFEDSPASGINGDQSLDSALDAGAAYLFTRSGPTWSQQAYVKASNSGAGDNFGVSVALSADGSTLAVGALLEDSKATGIGGNEADNSKLDAGAAYVFTRLGTMWRQQAYVKAPNTDPDDRFGSGVALADHGTILAVGAQTEDGSGLGLTGDPNDNLDNGAGAVYVYR
jgi:cysteine-rich repeat protein